MSAPPSPPALPHPTREGTAFRRSPSWDVIIGHKKA